MPLGQTIISQPIRKTTFIWVNHVRQFEATMMTYERATRTIDNALYEGIVEVLPHAYRPEFLQDMQRLMEDGTGLTRRQANAAWKTVRAIRASQDTDTRTTQTTDDGTHIGIVAMMHRANGRLKKTKITLQTDAGNTLSMTVCPETKRNGEPTANPLAIYLKNGGTFNADFLGQIRTTGALALRGNASPDYVRLLDDLSEDPVAAIAAHGHRTGRCCMCNSPLKTHESTTHGYGPVCAKNFGLPWSKRTADAIMADDSVQVFEVIQNVNGGSWEVIDSDTRTVIASFDNRIDALRYADDFSVVQLEGLEAGDPGMAEQDMWEDEGFYGE